MYVPAHTQPLQPEKHRTRCSSRCSLSTLSDNSIEREEDLFSASKRTLPSLHLLDVMYSGLAQKNKKAASGVSQRLLSKAKIKPKGTPGSVMPANNHRLWNDRVGRTSTFKPLERVQRTVHPLATKEEESVWYKNGVSQKPELRRSEKKFMNVGGSNMTSTKTYKVTELLNFDNSEVFLTTNGSDVTVHCPAVHELFEESLSIRPVKTKRFGKKLNTSSDTSTSVSTRVQQHTNENREPARQPPFPRITPKAPPKSQNPKSEPRARRLTMYA
eukprot:TRINITY_DN15950_c0_g1_i1.p1 TRINITY_DN15950_c0_g1~~TRINITY_DN15950_c0_g1_i1.p1  ORF type:complete len:272 (+),score=45.88 TRINITY_DN15950_c0_g1_i1:215-1030(+)